MTFALMAGAMIYGVVAGVALINLHQDCTGLVIGRTALALLWPVLLLVILGRYIGYLAGVWK